MERKKMCGKEFKEHAGIPMKQQFNGNVWGCDSLWMVAGMGWDSNGDVGSLGGGGWFPVMGSLWSPLCLYSPTQEDLLRLVNISDTEMQGVKHSRSMLD